MLTANIGHGTFLYITLFLIGNLHLCQRMIGPANHTVALGKFCFIVCRNRDNTRGSPKDLRGLRWLTAVGSPLSTYVFASGP